MLPTSVIEISKSALEHNLAFLQKEIGNNTAISTVVKGNAYGHGIDQFVPLARNCGQKHFSVFSAAEAYQVSKCVDEEVTIMIMGNIDNHQLEWAIENEIEFYVFDPDRLQQVVETTRRIRKKALVHIEVETGMNRTGLSRKNMDTVASVLKENQDLIVFKGLCTHFAGAESVANYYRIRKQKRTFDSLARKLESLGLIPEQYHTACSAAALRYPRTRMDMARVGILNYGFFPSHEVLVTWLNNKKTSDDPLRRIISWKTRIMDIKEVGTGQFIGYGTSYLANGPMKIAIIPVGYSDGFSRSLSNQGRVLIRGQRVPVVGIVNMNMMSVDVTRLPGVEKGDEVVLIGKQGELDISVSSFSDFSEQINYELLTRLPRDIPRMVT